MEFILALFYLSGFLKSFLLFYDVPLPIDFTLLATLLLLTSLLFQFKRFQTSYSSNVILSMSFLLLLYIWMVMTLAYTPSIEYSKEKTQLFSLNIIAFLLPILLRDFSFKVFFRIVVTISFLLSIHYVYLFNQFLIGIYSKETFEGLKSFYLNCALIVGLHSLVLIFIKEPVFKKKGIDYFFAVFGVFLLLFLGARGPLLAFFVFLILYFLFKLFRLVPIPMFSIKKDIFSFRSVMVVNGVVFLLITLTSRFYSSFLLLLERTIYRTNLILGIGKQEADMGSSVNVRVEQVNLSIDYIFENSSNFLFGSGIGGFGIIESGTDSRAYPHNVFLELWFELGIVGLLLFILFLFFALRGKGGLSYFGIILLAYILFNISKSNSIVDLRVFFVIFAFYARKSNSELIKLKQN